MLWLHDRNNILEHILAVESKYGSDDNTYKNRSKIDTKTKEHKRYGFGLFQMDQDTFDETKNIESHRKLQHKINSLLNILNIDWNLITFDDLNKPLIAYIATRMYLSNIRAWIPNTLKQQGYYWKKNYNKNYNKKNGIYIQITAKDFPSKVEQWTEKARHAYEKVVDSCIHGGSCGESDR